MHQTPTHICLQSTVRPTLSHACSRQHQPLRPGLLLAPPAGSSTPALTDRALTQLFTIGDVLGWVDSHIAGTVGASAQYELEDRIDLILKTQIDLLASLEDPDLFALLSTSLENAWLSYRERLPFNAHIALTTISSIRHRKSFPPLPADAGQ